MSSGLSKGASVGLRSEFEELTATEISSGNTSNGNVAAVDSSTAVRLIKTKNMAKVFFIDNSTNQPITLWVVGPEDTTNTKVRWLVVPAGKMINFELATNNLLIEAGTAVWASSSSGPTLGSLCMFTWG